ncbi:alpha/beta hydrolase [Paenibacillus sp. UMB4589-SE434]|uniref:alpha/beta hydrolase n=1 Tax=Paenibacillus sp. UMB4589-SE434 TaxID=3046314 RepID=UPI00254AD7A0|nr:alpha/beta hydrolase [Paenibacillus sp. UMB4589-SE434]MDK8180537.1 alpha/beta hydrolase [Paenibacillus sp. UMB4589-SE434]
MLIDSNTAVIVPRKKKWPRVVLIIFAVLLVLVCTGMLYQLFAVKQDQAQYPPVGQLLSINGHQMHLYSIGEGGPTVVLGAGLGTPSPYADFYPLYTALAKHTRVIVYEKAGYGWSEPTDRTPDIDTVTDELHLMLKLAGVSPPYIMVGHSLASLEAIHFAQKYKSETAGVVLLDGGNPDFYKNNTVTWQQILPMYAIRLATNIGLVRTLSYIPDVADFITTIEAGYGDQLPSQLKQLSLAMTLKNVYNPMIINELNCSIDNASKVSAAGHIGNIPLLIFTAGRTTLAEWVTTQQNLTDWSSQSTQFVLQDAGHYVHHHDPNTINEQIIKLIQQLRLHSKTS